MKTVFTTIQGLRWPPAASRPLPGTAFALFLGMAWLAAANGGLLGQDDPPDHYVPSRLTITIDPPEAAAGAGWQVAAGTDEDGEPVIDPGAWLASGDTLMDLPPGRYTVAFLSSFGWVEREPISITVAGGDVARTVGFEPLLVYDSIHDVPPLSVNHGETLSFLIAGPASVAGYDPHPEHPGGKREIGLFGGRFTYRPAADERRQFTMTLDDGSEEATVLITPLSVPAAEQKIFDYRTATPPDPEAKAYVFVTEEEALRVPLNHATQDVLDVTVSGHTLVFEKGHPNLLFERYAYDPPDNSVDHIRKMVLCADTVVIRGPLHLPQTEVEVFARELRFEDTGDEDAVLVTTPLAKPGVGNRDGADGLDAGNVTLHIAGLHAPPTAGGAPRLILDGGRGQDPAAGSDGKDGVGPLTTYGGFTHNEAGCGSYTQNFSHSGVVYFYVTRSLCGVNGGYPDFSQGFAWSRRGERNGGAATAAGVPGNGGHAGLLRAPFDLGSLYSAGGGEAGTRGRTYFGGSAGSPRTARWVSVDFNICGVPPFCSASYSGYGVDHTHTSSTGANAVSPEPTRGAGDPSALLADVDPSSWLHPCAVRAVLQYVKDAYLNGHRDVARSTLEPYAAALGVLVDSGAEVSPEVRQLDQEVATLLDRLDSRLDYFGNPAGWVPMLSFEVLLATFEQEVEAAGKLLYLANHLSRQAEDALADQRAVRRMQQELTAEIARFEEELGTREPERTGVLGRLLDLQDDADSINREIDARELDLLNRRRQLETEAALRVAVRSAFRIAGQILQIIPVSKPPLGQVGKGLESAAGPSDAPSVNLFDVFLSGTGSGIPASIEAFQAAEAGNTEGKQGSAESVKAAAIAGIDATLQNTTAFDSAVEAELDVLVAQDPASQAIVQAITDLNLRKQLFAERLLAALQRAQELMNGITQNYLALDSLSREAVEVGGRIDQEAFRYVKEMEQRAKDRLLKYQYYLGKAYEYRTMRPFSDVGNYQIQQVYDFFIDQQFPPNDGDPLLSASAVHGDGGLIAIYTDLLRDITEEIIEYLNEGPEQTDLTTYSLSPDELAQLNTPPYQVRINLVESGRVFYRTQENLRIFYLGVEPGTDGMSSMRVSAKGGLPANVSVLVQHSGSSLIRSDGETHRFTHYKTLENRPITWRLTYNAVTGDVTSPGLSPRSQSLLASLLGPEIDDLLLYSRPGADADLVLTKEVAADDVDMVIEELNLFVQFDYYEKRQNQGDLEVRAVNEENEVLMAPITVDGADRNGRRDGRGRFRRVYRLGDLVALEAPPVYGAYEFSRWVDRTGSDLGRDPRLEVTLPTNALGTADVLSVRAVYDLVAPEPVFRRGDSNGDGKVDISDGIRTLNHLFVGAPAPPCLDAADTNDDGATNITDVIVVLGFLFTGGPPPPDPGPTACGTDPTADALSCLSPICE